MDKVNKNKLQALHSLLDKELQLLQSQLNTETDQGYLQKNTYQERVKSSERQNKQQYIHQDQDEDLNQQKYLIQQNTNLQDNHSMYKLDVDQQGFQKIKNNYENPHLNYEGNMNDHYNQKDIIQNNIYANQIQNLDDSSGQNVNKQKQTFITDYGSQISFQQRTSQHHSQNQTDGFDDEEQYTNLIKHEQDSLDPFTNVNLSKEISGLQQKIQYLEQKLNISQDSGSKSEIRGNSTQTKTKNKVNESKDSRFYNEIIQKPIQNRQASFNDENFNNMNQNQQKCQQFNNQNYQMNLKKSKDFQNQYQINNTHKSDLLISDQYLNTQETFNTDMNIHTTNQYSQNKIDKQDKYQKYIQNSGLKQRPKSLSSQQSTSQKLSKVTQQHDFNNSFGKLEKDIEGAEYILDISKRLLKSNLNKSSSRKNLKTDTAINKTLTSTRQNTAHNRNSRRQHSQKSQRERSLSQGQNQSAFFPIDNYAQQYHDAVDLKQKIANIRKQYETEKDQIIQERENNKMINEEIERIQTKIKKVQMQVEKNNQNEKDYQRLQESYMKSEQITKQQKQLIIQLKEEIELKKNNQNSIQEQYPTYENTNQTKRRNSKNVSTCSSQKYPKKQ